MEFQLKCAQCTFLYCVMLTRELAMHLWKANKSIPQVLSLYEIVENVNGWKFCSIISWYGCTWTVHELKVVFWKCLCQAWLVGTILYFIMIIFWFLKVLMKTTRSLSVNRNHKKDDYSAKKIYLFCSYLDECLTQGWVRTKVKTETCTKYLCQRSSDTFPTYPEAMKLNY